MNCKNCNIELQKQDDYCRSCGGRVIRNRLTLKNLFEHLSETFFNYDNKLLRTITNLLRKPEDVIVGYINGVRKKYVNPISFFGLAITLSGLSVFILKKFYLQYLDYSQLFEGVEASQQIFDATSSNALEYNSLIYSFIVPFFAIISWVVFLDKKFNFTEHVIIYLYSMSLMSIFSVLLSQTVLLLVPDQFLLYSILTWPLMFIYHAYILKRIFKLSIGSLILKSFIFFALFFVLYMGLSILAFLIMLATGTIDLESLKPK
ncbi:DUF3667 domain-containing protein [Winogradskyella vincentii]|uniref:DUF3667 domain-containing protein n=1 Tax=Winogradskyella vincentii TaxID=2877122 RepID=A0ABS7Y187_9FLAO|nr:DUF3667 domain-containing protein [Winogradskyella vincentii]MCA0153652.1 DUF3667 domain-containing protein [Winogradskyella vincentii]